ncbi:MAG: cell wall hydrolase [Sphingomicrobium sp.]
MIRFLGGRGASAVFGFLMLALASTEAPAQAITPTVSQSGAAFDITAVVKTTAIDTSSQPLGALTKAPPATLPKAIAPAPLPAASLKDVVISPLPRAVAAVTSAVIQPVRPVTLSLAPAIAREAAWLLGGGWSLYALVDRFSAGAPLDAEATCLATAVYFEARGESPEGQLAVARVVMNRAASGRYPPTWCSTVKQPWQFSFVRNGQFPAVDAGCDAWRKAQAIARLAMSNAVPSLSSDVLWYHANYVAPSWGRRLTRVEKIGAHIFYRA